ncbi:hypothetical protein BDK61_3922 [Haloarcula quadrata]|mgnify:CR=1 FL=1|uniref:Uncharacterized protein n=1 Tax=Haloarcula quadrata TaxID=182779 RepID=A0A495QW51_9EURY|nr:hypothetical protein BDK61_3922 [Haloarcula quadrata]
MDKAFSKFRQTEHHVKNLLFRSEPTLSGWANLRSDEVVLRRGPPDDSVASRHPELGEVSAVEIKRGCVGERCAGALLERLTVEDE